MRNGLSLGKLSGIQIGLHYTWFVVFILFTASLVYPEWDNGLLWVTAVASSILFFASVLAHEMSHSLVGRANGIPVISITLFIFGGMAQMAKEADRPAAELKMAAAGPVCSLALGLLFGLVWWLVPGIPAPAATVLEWLALMNLGLAVFNMVPGFPLDGGRVFRSILWRITGNYRRSTRIATRLGQVIGYVFMAGGLVLGLWPGNGLHMGWANGLWLVFVGWFLVSAATTSYQRAKWYNAAQGIKAAQIMLTNYVTVPDDITVRQLVAEYILPTGNEHFMVSEGGRVVGLLTLADLKAVPESGRQTTLTRQIMTPLNELRAARPDHDAVSILAQMDEHNIKHILVVNENHTVAGLITRDKLVNYLKVTAELTN